MTNIIKRDFHGIQIAFEGKEQVSLTDLWKAAGSVDNKNPNEWARRSGETFINDLAQSLNTAKNRIWKSRRGKIGGGTWAHWQIGLAYAQYLSTDLHRFVNQCFMEYVQEANNPGLKMDRAIDGYRRKGKDDSWIEARLKSKLTTKNRNSVLSNRQDGDGNIYAMCSTATNRAIIGMDSTEYREQKQLAKSTPIRDHMSRRQLLEIALTEDVCAERIIEADIRGNKNCANVHSVVGSRIHHAVTTRGI